MNLKQTVVAALLFILAKLSLAGDTRHYWESADIVVVARFLSIAQVDNSTIKSGTDSTAVNTISVNLSECRFLKGSGPSSIQVAANKYLYTDTQPMNEAAFLKPNTYYVFFLQTSPDGLFYEDAVYDKQKQGRCWHLSKFKYATMAARVIDTLHIQVESAKVDKDLQGCVALAHLLAQNAALRNRYMNAYLQRLQELSDKHSTNGAQTIAAKEQTDLAMRYWQDKVYPTVFKPITKAEEVNDLAIRLSWGNRGLEDRFVKLYSGNPKALAVTVPTVIFTKNQLILAKNLPAQEAANWFSTLANAAPDFHRMVLEIAVKRAGVDNSLDIDILRCVSRLFNRSDLSPIGKDGQPVKDLRSRLEAMRGLLRNRSTLD